MHVIHVNERCSQTLRDFGTTIDNRYDWDSRFKILVPTTSADDPQITVVISLQVSPDLSPGVFEKWRTNVARKWNGKFKIGSGVKSYPVNIDLQVAKAETHYVIASVKDNKTLGGRGLFGTESMTTWGENDPQDIPHEVGHMLGNSDEYGVVDGIDWDTVIDAKDERLGTMSRGDLPVCERYFNLIRDRIAKSGVIGEKLRIAKCFVVPQGALRMQPVVLRLEPVVPSPSAPATVGRLRPAPISMSGSDAPKRAASAGTVGVETPSKIAKGRSGKPIRKLNQADSAEATIVEAPSGAKTADRSPRRSPDRGRELKGPTLPGTVAKSQRAQMIYCYLLSNDELSPEVAEFIDNNDWYNKPAASLTLMGMLTSPEPVAHTQRARIIYYYLLNTDEQLPPEVDHFIINNDWQNDPAASLAVMGMLS